jgi:hypothetical protein
MINLFARFAPRVNPVSGEYPYGSIKNESVPGANDGTPLDADWGNDYAGFDAALLDAAGITPSGDADTATDSQRLDALNFLYDKNVALFANLGTYAASVGDVVQISGVTVSGEGGGQYVAKSGSVSTVSPNQINSGTAGVYFSRIDSNSDKVTYDGGSTTLQLALADIVADINAAEAATTALDTEYTVTKDRLRSGRFTAPAGLGWNPPLSVFSTSMGEIRTDFDNSKYRYVNNRAFCWVDPTRADNSGDGQTLATAKRDLLPLLGSSTTYDTIYIAPGAIISRDAVSGWGGALTASKNIICVGGRAKITRRFEPASWTSLGGGEYSCARSGVKFCWDATQYDEFGDYVMLTKYATTGALTAAASGWWTDGTDLRVKRADLAQPTLASTAIFLQEGTGNGSAIINGNVTFYTENIDYEGGYAPLYAKATASGQNLNVHAKNCTFKYSYLQDGMTVINSRLTTSQNCRAARNVKDGFNYHADLYVEQCYFIEADCSAARNGIDQEIDPLENNRNASTAHDTVTGVRINTVGHDTHGPIIADVDGAKTWNIGVTAHNSQGDATDQKCNYIVTTAAKMWLDRCSGHSSPEGVVVGSSSFIYTRNCELEGTNNIVGTFTSY